MDRQVIYPGSIPLETDLLNTNKNTMIALSKLAAAILGTSTLLNGLACTPDSPASLNVKVAAGEIYALANIDGTAYSSLAADTTHSILKQGVMLDGILLACPAPAASGQSIAYLIQATYQDTDALPVVLPYYNASNPSQAYSGPNNSGTAQNTVRKGSLIVSAKAGISAATGSQLTPAPDTGYVGAYVVTVAYGQTQITAPNISAYSGAPFIANTLTQLAPLLSPALAGIPTAPTAAAGTSTLQLATTAFALGVLPKRSFAANDFIRIPDVPGGLIIQWGPTAATNPAADQVQALPVVFPTAFHHVFVVQAYVPGSGQTGSQSSQPSGLAQFVWRGTSSGNGCRYLAFGN